MSTNNDFLVSVHALFSRYMGALKYGIFGFTDSQTISPSQAWTNEPISTQISDFQLLEDGEADQGLLQEGHRIVDIHLDLCAYQISQLRIFQTIFVPPRLPKLLPPRPTPKLPPRPRGTPLFDILLVKATQKKKGLQRCAVVLAYNSA